MLSDAYNLIDDHQLTVRRLLPYFDASEDLLNFMVEYLPQC